MNFEVLTGGEKTINPSSSLVFFAFFADAFAHGGKVL